MKKLFTFLLLFLLISCTYDTTNRNDLEAAFKANFGFSPPSEIKEIKERQYIIRDAVGYWMSFTYNSKVFIKIIEHDQPLNIANTNTNIHENIVKELKSGKGPKWFDLTNIKSSNIYYKKDFLEHSHSEYYLWIDFEKEMVHLHVSYFD